MALPERSKNKIVDAVYDKYSKNKETNKWSFRYCVMKVADMYQVSVADLFRACNERRREQTPEHKNLKKLKSDVARLQIEADAKRKDVPWYKKGQYE